MTAARARSVAVVRVIGRTDLLAQDDDLRAAAHGAGAVAGAHDLQVAHGLLVVDDVGGHGGQLAPKLARGVGQEHLERQPHRVQVYALRVVAVREPGCNPSDTSPTCTPYLRCTTSSSVTP